MHDKGGGRCIQTTVGWVWKGINTGLGIRLALLNIETRRVGRLETALWALQKGKFVLGFLQYTKLNQGIHTRRSAGYNVWVMEVDSQHWGGVAVVWRTAKIWQFKGTASFGPNVLSFILMSGVRQWYIICA